MSSSSSDGVREVGLGEGRARPLQRAVDRGDARLEQLRRLARLPLQDLAEDERGSLLRRQVLQRCDEGEPQRLALLRELVRRRQRRDPGHLRQLREVLEERLLCGPEIHRPRPALAARERVEANVCRDPVQPRLERRAALEPLERPPGAQHRLLHGVLGVEGRAEHAVAVAGELAPVLLEGVGRGGLDGGHDRHPRQGASSRQSAAARSSSSISIFVIFSIAAMTR